MVCLNDHPTRSHVTEKWRASDHWALTLWRFLSEPIRCPVHAQRPGYETRNRNAHPGTEAVRLPSEGYVFPADPLILLRLGLGDLHHKIRRYHRYPNPGRVQLKRLLRRRSRSLGNGHPAGTAQPCPGRTDDSHAASASIL